MDNFIVNSTVKMNKIIFLILLLFHSCDNKIDFLDLAISKHNISKYITTIPINKDSIGNPSLILSFDKFLIIADNDKSELLMAFNQETKSYKTIIHKGNSREEALSICRLGKINDSTLYMYDDFSKKIIYLTLNNDNFFISNIKEYDSYSTFAESENMLIGCPKYKNYRYSVLNILDSTYKSFGNYDEYIDIPDSIGFCLSDGHITINNKEKKFAWFSLYAEVINIADYSNHGEIIFRLANKLPDYNIIKDEKNAIPAFSAKTTIGFISATSSNNNMYVLYNGRPFSDAINNKEDITLCQNICVFSWDGKFLANLNIDNKIKCIDFDKSNGNILMLALDEDSKYGVISISEKQVNKLIKN